MTTLKSSLARFVDVVTAVPKDEATSRKEAFDKSVADYVRRLKNQSTSWAYRDASRNELLSLMESQLERQRKIALEAIDQFTS